MSKKKIIFSGYLMVLMILFCNPANAHNYEKNQDTIALNINTDQIIKIDDKDILIRSDVYGFGLIRESISVYIRAKNETKEWSLFCTLLKITTEVHIEVNQEKRELIFRSKSDTILMIIPFAAFDLHTDM